MGLPLSRVSDPKPLQGMLHFHPPRSETVLILTIFWNSSARTARQPEESGPFGRNRSLRLTGSRTPRARTGTTPVRQKENSVVSDFGRLYAKEQEKEAEKTKSNLNTPSATSGDATRTLELEAIPTECILYGYAGKSSEWKVLSKFEKIVFPSIICEDYSRDDPNLLISGSPLAFSRTPAAARLNLSREALRKSRVYVGGQHWIKVTFDTYQAAERAIHYSPVEIDGYLVHCEMFTGKGPGADVALPRGFDTLDAQPLSPVLPGSGPRSQTLSAARTSSLKGGKDSAVAGFERAFQNQTLPRSHTMPDAQYSKPSGLDDNSFSSTTASSATATALSPPTSPTAASGLRSRSQPSLPSQASALSPNSEFMTHIKVKKAILRPASEALPPQPTLAERVLRSIPIVAWFVSGQKDGVDQGIIGEEPLLKDDGTWDANNGWYWTFWHSVDQWLGTDFCGLKDD